MGAKHPWGRKNVEVEKETIVSAWQATDGKNPAALLKKLNSFSQVVAEKRHVIMHRREVRYKGEHKKKLLRKRLKELHNKKLHHKEAIPASEAAEVEATREEKKHNAARNANSRKEEKKRVKNLVDAAKKRLKNVEIAKMHEREHMSSKAGKKKTHAKQPARKAEKKKPAQKAQEKKKPVKKAA